MKLTPRCDQGQAEEGVYRKVDVAMYVLEMVQSVHPLMSLLKSHAILSHQKWSCGSERV